MNFIKVTSLGLLSISLIQCADMRKREEQQKAAAQPAVITAPATPTVETPEPPSTQPPATGHAEHGRKVGAIAPEKALGWLKNGNTRYLKGTVRKDGASSKDITRLSTGQNPHTIVLSCSDSRVPPEVVFDQKLGEIFVVRTAGEMVDDSVLASIEYGVEHLGANLILVMGHSSCGAVKAAFSTPAGTDTGSPYINALVAEVQPRIVQRMRNPASAGFVAEGWDNARGVSVKLMEKSKIIRDAAKSGTLRVETALYHLDSGKVEWNDAKEAKK
jgi:carbonic anhydrase